MAKLTVGEFLAVLRKSKGMTQEEVAEKLDVSSKSVSSWENNRTYPDILLLPAIADLYGVSVDELIRGEPMQREETSEQTQEKTQTALLKMRKRKLAQYQQRRTTDTALAVIGALFMTFGLVVGTVWIIVLAIIGTLGFVAGLFLLWHHTKMYLTSEGIAFKEDVTEENGPFYLSVIHGVIIRINHAVLPFFLVGLIILLSYMGNVTTGFFIGLAVSLVPLAVIAGLLLWQRFLTGKYGNTAQYETVRSKRNIKFVGLFAVILVIAVVFSDYLFFGLLADAFFKAEPVDGLTFDTKEAFIANIQTLRIEDERLASYGIHSGDTFVMDLQPLRTDVETFREKGNMNDFYSKEYSAADNFYLCYYYSPYVSKERMERVEVYYQKDENAEKIWVKTAYFADVYVDWNTSERVQALNLYYGIVDQEDSQIYVYTGSTVLFNESTCYVFEVRDGKFALYRHTSKVIWEGNLHFTVVAVVLLIETVLYFVLRKKVKYETIQKTFA